MVRKLRITVSTNPSSNVNLVFQVSDTPNSNTYGVTVGVTVAIGANANATAENLRAYYASYSWPSWLTVSATRTSNVVELTFTGTSALAFTFMTSSFSGIGVTEYIPPASIPLRIALCRSTYSLRFVPTAYFDTGAIELYFWRGDIGSVPATPTYNLSKQVVQLGQTDISFDINELAKEFIETTVDNYENSGVSEINNESAIWCKYVFKAFDGSSNVYEVDGTLYCLYGYGYSTEGYNFNPSNVFLSTNGIHYRGYDNRVYFVTDGLTSLEVNGTPVTVTADPDNSTQYVMSINLNDYDAIANSLVVEATYGVTVLTYTYEVKEECKYDVVNCVYIDKFGVPKSLFFTKVRKEKDEIEGDSYKGLIANNGIYRTLDHQTKAFNVNGAQKITLNTDYLPEYMNENVRQLLLSERIWLIINGFTHPATIESKSVDYKTSLNDRLINYTMEFKYAQPIINTIC